METSNLSEIRLDEETLPELRSLTHALNEMLERLSRGFDAQRQFVGNAAHELRTPLTLLQTQLELFSDEHPDILPESAAFLDALQDEVQRLSRLTHALLDMGAKGIRALMEKQKDSLAESKRHLSAKPTLVVASSNQHKIRELQHIFGDYYTVVSMVAAGFNAPIEETATTFAGNAVIKAETVSAATGLPTIADDSGLSIEVLDGDPGVYSARYAMMAGEGSGDAANNALLLRRMKGKTDRSCAFICALALKIPGRETLIAEGSCPGVLLEEERGTGGFGSTGK